MEGQNGSGSQVPAAGVETPAPGPGTAVETVVPQVETAINQQLDQAIRAAEDAEGDPPAETSNALSTRSSA